MNKRAPLSIGLVLWLVALALGSAWANTGGLMGRERLKIDIESGSVEANLELPVLDPVRYWARLILEPIFYTMPGIEPTDNSTPMYLIVLPSSTPMTTPTPTANPTRLDSALSLTATAAPKSTSSAAVATTQAMAFATAQAVATNTALMRLPNTFVELDYPRQIESGESDSVRVSLIQNVEGEYTVAIESPEREIGAVTIPLLPDSTPGSVAKAFGTQYEGCAEATLAGSGFSVTETTGGCQSLRQGTITWEWNLAPNSDAIGDQTLNVRIEARWRPMDGQGPEHQRELWRERFTLNVTKAPIKQLGGWSALSALGGLGFTFPWLLGQLTAWRRRRRKDSRESLERQIASLEENLRLIEERKTQYVLETDVPLSLIREERRTRERLEELRRRLDNAQNE